MPFAPKIRKDLLSALDEHVLPQLQTQRITQIIAAAPFDFSEVECRTERIDPLPDKGQGPLQIINHWEQQGMISVRYAAFGFVYAGASHETVGITESMALDLRNNGLAVPSGITVLRLPAPGIICYPPHVPRRDGGPHHKPWTESTEVLCIKLMNDVVLVNLSARGPQFAETTHSLEIRDSSLVQMAHLYLDERTQVDGLQSAQAQLLAFMSRLRRAMSQSNPHISNTCWVNPDTLLGSRTQGSPKNLDLCDRVIDYAQTHLHEQLTLQTLSLHCGYSEFHLNRVFRQVHNTTVMHYITQLRIKAAQRILLETPERVSDVAKLVGFSSATGFSNVFRKHTGLSPNSFRRQNRQNVHN